jgi:hypothetical protein
MTEHTLFHLRYPIGKFTPPDLITSEHLQSWTEDIARLPQQLREAVSGLSESQLNTPYRPEGWTIRQVVHHVADSHLNAYVRYKLTLTEDNPTIKPYYEDRWALLADTSVTPIGTSLALLEALHERWMNLIRSLSEADFQRTYFHPEQQKAFSLAAATGTYSWHGRHHLAHITELGKREGW